MWPADVVPCPTVLARGHARAPATCNLGGRSMLGRLLWCASPGCPSSERCTAQSCLVWELGCRSLACNGRGSAQTGPKHGMPHHPMLCRRWAVQSSASIAMGTGQHQPGQVPDAAHASLTPAWGRHDVLPIRQLWAGRDTWHAPPRQQSPTPSHTFICIMPLSRRGSWTT